MGAFHHEETAERSVETAEISDVDQRGDRAGEQAGTAQAAGGEGGLMPTLHEVVGSVDRLMGVKAVWGRSTEPVMCFGSRGKAAWKDDAHYSAARSVAEQALISPYFITIGGGKSVADELRGRSVELIRATAVFGDTKVLVRDEAIYEGLKQWPVGVVCSEVWSVDGEPHVIDDLGMPDLLLLQNAFDNVRRYTARINDFWASLASTTVSRRWDVLAPPGFQEPTKLQKCGLKLPTIQASEGSRIYKEVCILERNAEIAAAAKKSNREQNGGSLVCASCDVRGDKDVLFDAHHRNPLSNGERISAVDNFVILCPTCHRWAHHLSASRESPLSVEAVRDLRRMQVSD